MFAIPGISALVVFILARPQEFIPFLTKLPLLYLFCGAALGGFVLDLKLRRLEPRAAPTFWWVVLFMIWMVICNAAMVAPKMMKLGIDAAILFVLYTVIGHSVQRLRSLQILCGVTLGTMLFLSVVTWHQGHAEHQCIEIDPTIEGDVMEGVPDGRECENSTGCYENSPEPGLEYSCERVGKFGTFTVEDRVRYRGELMDPNELSLALCCLGFSFLIAFGLRNKTPGWRAFCYAGGILIVWVVLLTQSRGGLIVALAVPGVYMVKRYGIRALLVGGMLASPVLMLGGRGGEKADESTQFRYEAWAKGFEMFKESPLFGVGQRQFAEHHWLAAHNSYVLTLAELGIIGMFLFITLIYMSFKTLLAGLKALEPIPEAAGARVWGMSLLASFAGLTFQINTLSFAYHSVLWIMLGLVAAWYSAIRTHKQDLVIKMTGRDFLTLLAITLGYAFFFLPLFLKYKGEM